MGVFTIKLNKASFRKLFFLFRKIISYQVCQVYRICHAFRGCKVDSGGVGSGVLEGEAGGEKGGLVKKQDKILELLFRK